MSRAAAVLFTGMLEEFRCNFAARNLPAAPRVRCSLSTRPRHAELMRYADQAAVARQQAHRGYRYPTVILPGDYDGPTDGNFAGRL